MKLLLFFMLGAACLNAQDTVDPPRGDNTGNYNIVQSFEAGYRYSLVGGDVDKYRSDVNYGNGIRLLHSYLTVNSRDGHGSWFDEIVLTTQGLGNDPYEAVTLRVQKNRLYRYDMSWRLNDYFNPGLATAGGAHTADLTERWQDHDLALFPQSHFRFHAGYGRNTEDGTQLSTVNLFDSERGSIDSLFSNVKQVYNSYRVGVDVDLAGFRLSFLRRWEFYKEDTPYSLGAPSPNLTSFYRSAPIHGETPAWLLTLVTEHRLFAINGRFTYAGGNRNFVLNENAIGTGLFGADNRLIITYGDAKRPVTTGDLNFSWFPSERWTITNNTSADNTRMSGNSYYEQFDLATLSAQILNFQFLGIRLITNSTDVHFHVTKKVDLFTGFRYVNRQIRSIQSVTDPSTPFTNTLNSQTNQVYAGVAGVNWIISGPLRLHLATEVGQNTNPFYPISAANYFAIDSRLQYRRKSITASAGYRQTYNNNSITLTSFSSHSRNYFANFSWAARDWISVDLGYSKLHLDTLGGIAFFASQTLQTGESIYISNIHAANAGVRIALRKRADLYLGYNLTLDTGDGRSSLEAPGTVSALFYNVQTYPLSFQTPVVRLTIPIAPRIKWNAGYQFYNYHEEFGLNGVVQNYHATTGYTSILWAF
jgi:hypothetical protein